MQTNKIKCLRTHYHWPSAAAKTVSQSKFHLDSSKCVLNDIHD